MYVWCILHQTLSAGTTYDTIPCFDEYSHHFNSFDKATIKPQKVEILHLYMYTWIKKNQIISIARCDTVLTYMYICT